MGWLAVTTGVSAELVIASNYAPPDQFEFHALTSILGPLYLSLKKMKNLLPLQLDLLMTAILSQMHVL